MKKIRINNFIYVLLYLLLLSCKNEHKKNIDQKLLKNSKQYYDTLVKSSCYNVISNNNSDKSIIHYKGDSLLIIQMRDYNKVKYLSINNNVIKINTTKNYISFSDLSIYLTNNKYILNRSSFKMVNDVDTFELIDYSWVPRNRSFEKSTLDYIKFSEKHRTFGSNFFTTFEVLDVSDFRFSFLIGSFLHVSDNRIKEIKENLRNCELFLPIKTGFKQDTLPRYTYYGLSVR
jgi:hypothetical protein